MRIATLLLLLLVSASASAKSFVYVSNGGDKTISIFSMDEEKGDLTLVKTLQLEGAPGPMALSPDQKFAYVSASRPDQLISFATDPETGDLKQLESTPLDATSCFIYCDPTGKWLLNAYYSAGKVTVHPVSGGDIGDLSQTFPTAQNAHCIRTDATNKFALVPHTGPNKVFQFKWDATSGKLTANDPPSVDAPGMNEPRHIQFHPTLPLCFSSDEYNDSITSYDYDPAKGTLQPRQTVSTLPADYEARKANTCADIELTADGKFALVSNRGHNSIARFAIGDDGQVTALGQTPTENTPRSFNLSPSQKFLYSAGQKSDQVAAYRFDKTTGDLTQFAAYKTGKTPSWVQVVTFAD
ncbi:lactonase family protein [Blastopirellula sp. JC732]|uniref:Lactonase family protein n=1 Tax=Blastopirellula sediminis TaxID=2894196 RepID=A0A9X1MSJ0_9BACT|nr:lactonase family protein [Blastopirellula sediminis]MCC9605105.1 lactonase family protein [Blastopirellula sediminis]MCC9631595.1 lactonase family protein [Blastopirellula sediminis]